MRREAVTSSNIDSAGYDPSSSTLEIEFKDGRVYQYFDVPRSVFDGLLRAASVGQYFHREIRGVFRYSRV